MYYVYVYLDPRKSGYYIYDELKFDYEPFYVGKGKNDRDIIHLSKCRYSKSGSYIFYDKLNKLLSLDIIPIILRIKEFEVEEESLLFEKAVISKIGRMENGPLVNLTDGGIGGDTFSSLSEEKREEVKRKRSKSMLGKNKGKKCSEEQKLYYKELYTGKKNPEHSKFMKEYVKNLDILYKKEQNNKQAFSSLKDKSVWDKKINQYTLDDIFIKTYNNYRELKTLGFDSHRIIKICNRGKGKSKNYKWRWYE